MSAPVPHNESERLAALHRTGLLDTLPEQVFDDIAQLAALICGTPIALISLVDEQRQWFKARVGLGAAETHRDLAFCAHAILAPEDVFVVKDALADARFSANPLVTADPHIRFYAGAPVTDAQGLALGTVCAIDREPRELGPQQRQALQALSRQVSTLIEWRQLLEHEQNALHDQLQQERANLFIATAAATQDLALTAYFDRDHVVRYVNDCFLRYWQLRRDQVVNRPLREVLGDSLHEATERERLDRALAGEMQQHAADINYPLLGTRHMALTYVPVRDSQGHVSAVVMRAQDVHEEEQARLALAAANTELAKRNAVQARFIHMMSHDLREPMNSIVNFTELLTHDVGPQLNAQSRRHLSFVQQGGERMRQLLDDLLDYVRLEGREDGALRCEQVALDVLIQEVLADLASSLDREQAVLKPGRLPVVVGDRSLLRVLLQNLLSNALKFHRPGQAPQVAWGSSTHEGGARFWVRDGGIGIAAHLQPKLFAAFSRLVTRQEFSGTGLGLAICKRIVDLHGGCIDVTSEPGQGSTFGVWLPESALDRKPTA